MVDYDSEDGVVEEKLRDSSVNRCMREKERGEGRGLEMEGGRGRGRGGRGERWGRGSAQMCVLYSHTSFNSFHN